MKITFTNTEGKQELKAEFTATETAQLVPVLEAFREHATPLMAAATGILEPPPLFLQFLLLYLYIVSEHLCLLYQKLC